MSEKHWLRERRQISKVLKLAGIGGEDIAPVAFVVAAIQQLQAKLHKASKANKDLCGQLAKELEARTPTLEAFNTANNDNERLRRKIGEAIDVLPTYPACAKQCLMKALKEQDKESDHEV